MKTYFYSFYNEKGERVYRICFRAESEGEARKQAEHYAKQAGLSRFEFEYRW